MWRNERSDHKSPFWHLFQVINTNVTHLHVILNNLHIRYCVYTITQDSSRPLTLKNNHEFSHSVALSWFQFQITALYFLCLFSIVVLYSYWECTSQNNTTGELEHYFNPIHHYRTLICKCFPQANSILEYSCV